MIRHIRVHLILIAATFAICSIAYPLVVWAVGWVAFPTSAAGSLVTAADGRGGSRLIGQNFNGDEYFQPRPSAAGNGYDAKASSGSNWGASNVKLRDRAARILGTVARYSKDPRNGDRAGKPVGPFIEQWFGEKPDRAATWANDFPTLAANWVKSDDATKSFVSAWAKTHSDVLADWKKSNPTAEAPDPAEKSEEFAVQFFASYAKVHPGTWPAIVENKIAGTDKSEKGIKPAKQDAEIQRTFFDLWLQENKTAILDKVPADMVMASGSGLDPHITLKNALYQLDRVADAWAAKTGLTAPAIKAELESLVRERAAAPLFGQTGEQLINVLEVNLAVRERMQPRVKA